MAGPILHSAASPVGRRHVDKRHAHVRNVPSIPLASAHALRFPLWLERGLELFNPLPRVDLAIVALPEPVASDID